MKLTGATTGEELRLSSDLDAAELTRTLTDSEYARLLGLPAHALGANTPDAERFTGLASAAREWYASHGRPHWALASGAVSLDADDDVVRLQRGDTLEELHSRRLVRTLSKARAHALVVAAVTVGPELELESGQLWQARPDEAWFLDRLGAALTEHIVRSLRTRLDQAGHEPDRSVSTLLPHFAPGYDGWSLTDQEKLVRFLARAFDAERHENALGVELLASGMLRPKNSMLVTLGVTCESPVAVESVPCHTCSTTTCAFQRTVNG